jgi:hypothetical protein
MVGSMGADSGRRDASVHAITEEGRICPAVGTAALTERPEGCQRCALPYARDDAIDAVDTGRNLKEDLPLKGGRLIFDIVEG